MVAALTPSSDFCILSGLLGRSCDPPISVFLYYLLNNFTNTPPVIWHVGTHSINKQIGQFELRRNGLFVVLVYSAF